MCCSFLQIENGEKRQGGKDQNSSNLVDLSSDSVLGPVDTETLDRAPDKNSQKEQEINSNKNFFICLITECFG